MRAVTLALTRALLETVVARPILNIISVGRIWDIGETVELLCFFDYAEDNPVLWVKVNREDPHKREILSSDFELLTKDNRFAIKRSTKVNGDSRVLQIKDVQETDAGFYHCGIQLSVNDFTYVKVKLEVGKPLLIINDKNILAQGEQ